LTGYAQEAMVGLEVGVLGHVSLFSREKTYWTRPDPRLARLVISSGASGHDFDSALTNFATVEDQRSVFE
jgi:hypothetical protein